MSTTITVVIIAIVVIALIVVVALVQRSKKHPKTAHMGLPELGALSTDGLDKQHAAHHDRSTTPDQTPPESRA